MLPKSIAILLIAALASGCATAPRSASNLKSPVDPTSFLFSNEGQWDSPPKLVSGYNAIYPASLLMSGIQGDAVLKFTIGTDGATKDFAIEYATDARFANHAILALKDWKFQPAVKNGMPVEARATRTFTFRTR